MPIIIKIIPETFAKFGDSLSVKNPKNVIPPNVKAVQIGYKEVNSNFERRNA